MYLSICVCARTKKKMFSKDKDDSHQKDKGGDDDSDGGWSDDEKQPLQTPAQQSNSAAPKDKDKGVLTAGEKLPSGTVVKKSVGRYYHNFVRLFVL